MLSHFFGRGWKIISSEWSERSSGININGRIYSVSVTTHSPISVYGLPDEPRQKRGLVKIALYLYYTVKHPQIGIGFNDASSSCDGWSSDDLSLVALRKASLIFKSRQINDEITEFIPSIATFHCKTK